MGVVKEPLGIVGVGHFQEVSSHWMLWSADDRDRVHVLCICCVIAVHV